MVQERNASPSSLEASDALLVGVLSGVSCEVMRELSSSLLVTEFPCARLEPNSVTVCDRATSKLSMLSSISHSFCIVSASVEQCQ